MSQAREPLYVQIRNHFKGRIWARELREDDKIPTEKELMKQFGVSRITVVNALAELVKDGWIYRIPGRGSYVRGIPEAQVGQRNELEGSAHAQQQGTPNSERGQKVGLVFPSLADGFAVRLVQGVADQLHKQGYILHLMLTYNSKETEKAVIRELKNTVDGLVIFPVDAEVYNEEIIRLKLENYPFVLIDRRLPGVETNSVSSDGRQAAKLAVDHLWELGHRKIAICSDSPMMTGSVDERIQGYFDALKQQGAFIDPALILNGLETEHPLRQLIQQSGATAYIALNSSLGVRMLTIARESGLRVPEEVSILCFDNPTPLHEELSLLTHIDQSEYRIGVEAVQLLIAAIEDERNSGTFRNLLLEPHLIHRQTTAAVKKGL